MNSFFSKTLIVALIISLFPNISLASQEEDSASLSIIEPDSINLDQPKKRRIEYLILRDRFKTILPKLAVGLGIFSSAVLFDYYQQIHGEAPIDEQDSETCAEQVHSLSKSAYHIVEKAMGNQFFLGSICASFGADGVRATFDVAEYLMGKFIGARNLDSKTEIDRNLLAIQMEMNEKLEKNLIPQAYCKHIKHTLNQGIFPKQSYNGLHQEDLIPLRRYWQALKDLPHEPITIDFNQAWKELEPIIENFDEQFQQSFKIFIKKLSIEPSKMKDVEDMFDMSLDSVWSETKFLPLQLSFFYRG